ncbi:MAG: bifunctional riboflavin kinase/FAD synthetase [Dysgonamonadaceae bacterium]|jgi:riboflavin kinase/FMN adenylyltransferase|nr:bifunctional riboflavin kinase/FAD synthetase [Dysgonamonadaceae bacterium]
MEIIYISESTVISEATIATIGFFDGVHRGHRYLLSRLKAFGKQENLKTAIITFPVHPRKVLHRDYQPQLLNTLSEKLELLASAGIDYCYIPEFSVELSRYSARDFMREILKNKLNIKGLLIGYDHRFGKNRADEAEQYMEYGKMYGMKVFKIDEFEGENEHISSTHIRTLLSEGDIRGANRLLSYNYFIQGKVIEGNKIGRTIGFPTANIQCENTDKILPKEGIYAVYIYPDDNRKLPGMAYIGKRPTVSDSGDIRPEAHIFDFYEDLYNKQIRIEFIDFLREGTRFQSLDELKRQLIADKKHTLSILQNNETNI